MKNIIAITSLLAAGTALANAATLIADWDDFSNLTSSVGDYTLTISGSTSVSDGVLNVVGASGGSAKVDLSAANLTLVGGFSISLELSNVGNFDTGKGNPKNLFAVGCTETDFLAGIGLDKSEWSAKFAFNGSINNITTSTVSQNCSSLANNNVSLVTVTLSSSGFVFYLNGESIATGTYTTTTYDSSAISNLALGSWPGSSGNGLLNESVHSLSVYNGVLTAEEVRALIPEPSAFGLLAGLGALALAGTRRRRAKKA
ncbi:MAG: LamG-like jellyroll fold domain-containing protein [Candidatus Spyradosoma sp.]